MSNILLPVLFILFLLDIGRLVLFHTYLWQLKEYRLDRLQAFLTTGLGKKVILNPLSLVKWILLFFLLGFSNLLPGEILTYIMIVIYAGEMLFSTRRGIQSIKIPVFTPKALVIIFFSISLLAGFTYYLQVNFIILKLSIAERVLPLIIFTSVSVMNFFSLLVKKILIISAQNKLKAYPDLLTVGITGSYGKTSTKEFLYQILATKYSVLKTFSSNNTEIAVARTVISKVNSTHKIFIAEMGAYRKGEIADLCSIVKPAIGIITGINEQHLQLFGSLENTMKTKFELINNLSPDGHAVFNLNNAYVSRMMEWCRRDRLDIKIFGYQRINRSLAKFHDNILYYKILSTNLSETGFEMYYGKEKIRLLVNLSGVANIDNVVAAIMAAKILGLSLKEISKAVCNIRSPSKTMSLIKQKTGNIFLLDDTFNANPDGIYALLNYMKMVQGKKVLILTPLIELGSQSDAIHRKIGREGVKVCDMIFLTNKNYHEAMLSGCDKQDKNKIRQYDDKTFYSYYQSLPEKSLIAFEGKEAAKILTNIKICKYV